MLYFVFFFFFKQKTAYERRISDWSSDVCSSDLTAAGTDLPMPGADMLAAILYTSGTTGAPKGVALSHRNLAANAVAIIDYLALGPDDSTVSVLPFHYAYGASVLHTHLAVGARVVLEDNLVFPHLVAEALARERAPGFPGVPSTFAPLPGRGRLDQSALSAPAPDDSTVSGLPFHYAYGASVLHTHLAVGARVVLEDNLVFPHLVAEALARERATGFPGVPSTFALLLERGRLDQYDLSSLRYLTQAGGAMAPALTRRVHAAFPQARLFVMYGQTEASARLTRLTPERLDDKLGSVGTPIDGVEIRVRRVDGSEASPGEAGEVCARGDNVMTGYWNAPEATAATLVDGWLRTGDLGHLDADGFLWLAGRRSDMIKTGAHRVHPQDVEEVIAELPGVREVAVTGVDDALLEIARDHI